MARRIAWHTLCALSLAIISGCGTAPDSALTESVESVEMDSVQESGGINLWAEPDAMDLRSGGRPDEGRGPGMGGDKYDPIVENPFHDVTHNPLSTFSIDVDTASYAKMRMYLLNYDQLPPPDAIRLEELINYFDYEYEPPQDEHPFTAHIESAECPWQPQHHLVRIGIKGREMPRQERPDSNLVFLLDVSGSMEAANKLPLLKRAMRMLVEQLGPRDRVAIVVYAGAAGIVLPSTPGDEKSEILSALDRLEAGGSTAGGKGLQLAYDLAKDNFIKGGVNRVILCTDGDFNVGTTSTGELVRLVEERAADDIFLSALGFGMGNHNDAMMEQISNRGNGNYAFVDRLSEAQKVLVQQMSSTLVTIAKDVKIQVEFNPAEVASYRLLGYENRILAAEDFNDDRKDAGEIGAGHTVTALYEVVPVGMESDTARPEVDGLRYQQQGALAEAAQSGELLTLKMRYKLPEADESQLVTFPFQSTEQEFAKASDDFQMAAAVAAFGLVLRDSAHKGEADYPLVLSLTRQGLGRDKHGYRGEFLELVEQARQLARREPARQGS